MRSADRHNSLLRWWWPVILALAPSLHAQEWVMERINAENGLPQNSVVSVAMDDQGYVWASTEGGLVRYDGSQVELVPLPVPQEGPQRMRDIIRVGDGRFAIRDGHGHVFVLDHGRLKPHGPMDVDRDPYPYCSGEVPVLEDYLFTVQRRWRGAKSFEWADHTVTLIRLSDREWLATSLLGLLHMRDTTLVGVIPSSTPMDRYFGLGGKVFGFDASNRPYRVDLTDRTKWPIVLVGVVPPTGMPPTSFFDGALCTNHFSPCVRVGDALFRLKASPAGDTLFAEPLHIDLPKGADISAILVDDARGIVLLGTRTQGLFIYRHTPMLTQRCPDEDNVTYAQALVGHGRVVAMSRDHAHGYIATGCDPEPVPFGKFNAFGVLNDRYGRVWYGDNGFIHIYDPNSGATTHVDIGRGPMARAGCYFEDGDSVWVGLNYGIGYVRNGRFTFLQEVADKGSVTVNRSLFAIRRGPDGALWTCNCSGAFRLNASGTTLTPVPGLEGLCVRMFQLIGKRMYIGTYGSGAWVYEHDSLRQLPRDRMGYLDYVHAFMPDSLGFLWMSTNHGLFRVHQRDIDAYLAGRESNLFYAYYGKASGILNVEFNGGCDPTYVRLPSGYASFPSLGGAVWFKPERIPDPYPMAPVRLDQVLADGAVVEDGSFIALRPDRHELVVRFSVSYWGEPANVQLVYQLSGVQDQWYPLGPDQRELRFQHLPYGDHTLTVRKLGTPPNGERGDLVLRFTVRKPYYLAGWFFLLCGGGLVGVYVVALRIYQLRLRRQNIALGRMVRSRTLELQSINQQLERSVTVKERLVSIISHDIVTPLRFIARVAHRVQDVSAVAPAQEIAGTLHDIALSSDKLYMNARNLLNWIKHQGGHIELRRMHVAMAPMVDDTLGPVRELASSKGTELLNMVPLDDVVFTDRDVVGIILQNLVNNALNHGEGGRIIISGEQRPGTYHLTVADNGPGLPEHTVNAIRLLQQHSGRSKAVAPDVLGLGYVIITELLQLLGGEVLIADNAGRGSRITIVLPPLPDSPGPTDAPARHLRYDQQRI